LIDDDAELCSLLVELVSREGFSIECEHEGGRGLDRALHGGFDLVLLDVMLPAWTASKSCGVCAREAESRC